MIIIIDYNQDERVTCIAFLQFGFSQPFGSLFVLFWNTAL